MCRNVLVCLCFSLALLALSADAASWKSDGADVFRIDIDPENGALNGLMNHANGFDFIDPASEPDRGLWQLDFGGDSPRHIKPSEAAGFSMEGERSVLHLVWDGFGIAEAPGLRVEVQIQWNGGLGMNRWHIDVQGAGNIAIEAVHFPRIAAIRAQRQERLAVPVWMGECTSKARELIAARSSKRMQWDYPGPLSLQCVALWSQVGHGFYLACEDGAALRKSFAAFGGKEGTLGLEVVQYPERKAGAPANTAGAYAAPYDVIVGPFDGDWITAAERYREWGKTQTWALESRVQKDLVPDWIEETGLWVWNRGRSENVLKPAAYVQEQASVPVSVFWHWWHGCPYDVGFPEYLPPREGAEPFREAVAEADAKGIRALVYMNQRLWGMTTRSWTEEGAEKYAVKKQDGTVRREVYNTFTKAPCAPMCIATPFWRNTYASLAEQAVCNLGVGGIYMDQACLSLPCYDPTHGHPLGGGTYWLAGFHELVQDIRQRCAAARVPALAGEGCGEPWLPYLDLMLSLQVSKERYAAPGAWEPIPFFQAVYHQHAIFYGNYSSLSMPPYDELWPAEFAPKEPLALLDPKFARQFRMEQARAFVWGQQPTIANLLPKHFEQCPEEVAYALRLAQLRQRVLPFLLHGRFLRPPRIDVPEATLDMSRLSIYAGQQNALKEFQAAYPLALAGAWRAPNGDIAVALASIADEPLAFPLEVSRHAYRPFPENGIIRAVEADGESEVGSFEKGSAEVPVQLPPRGARVYIFSAADNPARRSRNQGPSGISCGLVPREWRTLECGGLPPLSLSRLACGVPHEELALSQDANAAIWNANRGIPSGMRRSPIAPEASLLNQSGGQARAEDGTVARQSAPRLTPVGSLVAPKSPALRPVQNAMAQ